MIRKLKHTDTELIEALIEGGSAETEAFKFLYRNVLPQISVFVQNNSGDEAMANDVFQEGLIAFYKQVKLGKFRGESAVKTYLFSICKFIWFRKLKKEQRYASFEVEKMKEYEADPSINLVADEKREVIHQLFEKVGEQCKQVLMMSIYEKVSMELIAQKLGFKDGQNARNKKFKCMKKLKELISGDPAIMNLVQQVR